MLTMQFHPELHRVVHTLKIGEERKVEHPSVRKLSLSKEESSALVRTFNRPASSRIKELLEIRGDWD